jgi:UDP-2-acetamido-2,6-beta-L-arabino-hexul-4-ose reductase
MIKIGITGQAGFVGTHLFNTLGLYPDKFERIPFEDEFFQDKNRLEEFVKSCDAIVHLAAMNRHNDPEVLYQTNIGLVKQLIESCEATKSAPHILFSSSTQEERDNLYGKSKKEGRQLFEQWAQKHSARFTGFVIPNVFGPFGNPYYNSVVATFCHQLTHEEQPRIEVDGEIKLIYVGELVQEIINKILFHSVTQSLNSVLYCETFFVPHTSQIKVSALLQKLTGFKENYFDKGILPCLDNPFDRNLFNTFLCYVDHSSFFPFKLKLNTDERGSFVETVKLNSGGQVSFSTTVPGITRGNHFHTRKAERFAVIKGKARIELRRIGTNKIYSFELDGKEPSFVDMPVWYTHNITNIGEEELYTIFWINEHFDTYDPDTYFEKVRYTE